MDNYKKGCFFCGRGNTEEQQQRIRSIFSLFSIPYNPDFYQGFSYISDDDINRLKTINSKGLKINSTNIFPIVGTNLSDEEIETLKDRQQKGVEAKTRGMLLEMLSGYDKNVEICHIADGLNIEGFFNDYLEEHGFTKFTLNHEEENTNVLSEEEVKAKFIEGVDELRNPDDDKNWEELYDCCLDPNSLDYLTSSDVVCSYDEFIGQLKGFSDDASHYLEQNNDVSDEIKNYLNYIINFLKEKNNGDNDVEDVDQQLTFDDLCKKYGYLTLVRLFFYLKITDEKIINEEISDERTFYEKLYELKKCNLGVLYYFYEKGIKINGDILDFIKGYEFNQDNLEPVSEVLYFFYRKGIKINGDILKFIEGNKFNQNNLKFISEYLWPKECEEPIKLFKSFASNIETINLLANEISKEGSEDVDSAFARLKVYLPNINFEDKEIIQKLARCNIKMFDEKILELIFKYFISKDSKDPINEYISYNNDIDAISLLSDDNFFGEFKRHFPNLTFSEDIIKKLVKLDKRMFDENNLKFIFENLIPSDSKNPFNDYTSYNKKIDKIDMIVKKGLLNTRLLKLLSEKFGIKKILGICNIDDLSKVGEDDNYDLLITLYQRLARGNEGFSHRSDPKLDELAKSFDRDQPYKSVKLPFTQKEEEEVNSLCEMIHSEELEIQKLEAQIKKIRDQQKGHTGKIDKISSDARCRYENERKMENAQKEKKRQATLQFCNSFFKGGINEDNFKRIYDEFFDIVFDGKNDKFLKKIPHEIINNTEFLTNVINLSLKNGTPHRTFGLYKYLDSDESFETVYKIMSEKSYFGSLIYGAVRCGKDSDIFKYILLKYGEMPTLGKAKLLPYLSFIEFKSYDDFNKFLGDILAEFGILCLEPYNQVIKNIQKKFNHGNNDTFTENSNMNEYFDRCKNRLYGPDVDINSIYAEGSGELLGEFNPNLARSQKYVLSGIIHDSQNIDFCLGTHYKCQYHKELPARGQYFGGGFLSLDNLNKKIHVYGYSVDIGKVHTNLYPVIEDILNKEFPDYVVEFGNPNFYPN